MHTEGWIYIWYGSFDSHMEEFGYICCAKLFSLHLCCKWLHQYFFVSLCDYTRKFVLDDCVCEEYAPYAPFARMSGHSGFDYYIGPVKDATTDNIQEIISLGGSFIWNDATICGGRMGLKILVREWYKMWKFLESESAMILLFPFMYWEYRNTLLLTRVQPRNKATMPRNYFFTGSNEALLIQPSSLEISIKTSDSIYKSLKKNVFWMNLLDWVEESTQWVWNVYMSS